MKRKLFFVTFLMLLCSLGFGQAYHFPEVVNNGEYENNMNITTVISFDGEEQSNANLELGIFCGNEIRGRVFTQNIAGRQYARTSVFGKTGEAFSFKVYDHTSGIEWEHGCTITFDGYTEEYLSFNKEGYGSLADPCVINFTTPNKWSVDEYKYYSQMSIIAVVEIDEVELSNPNLELGAFCNDECRGSVKTDFTYEHNGVIRYYARMNIYGNEPEENEPAEVITFKLYNHDTKSEYENFVGVNTITFESYGNIGTIMSPLKVNFLTKPYVAEVNGKKYQELDEAFKAAQSGGEVKIIYARTYALNTSGKDLTITATVDGVVFDNISTKNMGGANVTFNNVTFDYYPNVNYTGLQHSGNLVYNNCTFNGQVFLYGNKETFNNCTFNQNSSDAYNVWTYGAKEVAFNECNFNSAGKSVLIYSESATVFNDVTVTACTFKATQAVDGKAAIEMDSSLTSGINLTISNTTATGFGNGNVSGNSLWNNKKGNDTDVNNDITVVVDDVTVLAPIYEAQIGEVKYRKLGTAFTAAQAGDVVTVFEGTYAMPSMKAGITIVGEGEVVFNGTLSGTLENLTMKNIHIKGSDAQRWAYAKGNLLFENVTFEATSVYALHFDGITEGTNLTYKDCTIIGWAALGGTPASCTFEGCTIKGNGSYGVIRTYFNTTIKDCTFDVANVNTTDVYQDGIHAVGETTTVTVTNCTNSRGEMIDLVNVSGYSVVDLDGTKIMNVAKIVETTKHYWTVTEAINAAQDGQTVELLARTINEEIKPWAGDAQHTSEKSITIVGAENFGTTLTGGLYLGYDDSGCREHNITIEGIAFKGKGILVAGQQNVVIQGNKFTNITDVVSTSQSAKENAISVIGKNVNATVTGNVIDGTNESGIHLRDVKNATVTGNTVANTQGTSITINPTSGSTGTIAVVDNTLSNWGVGGEGRAIRISGGATVNVNGNVMSNANAPEEFVKITGATIVDASANYWNGNTPLAEKMFYTDLTSDPVGILMSYYTDSAKQNLVTLSASVAKIGNKYYQTLQAAIDACVTGDNTIVLLANISEDVTIKQVEGINVTIDGDVTNRFDYSGTFTIHGNARNDGAETLTFVNIDFTTNEADHYFIDSNSTGSVERYAHNVTVKDCNFKATDAGVNTAVAMRIRQGFNIVINGGTFANLHSALQAYGNAGITTVDGIELNGKNGISAGTSTNVVIKNSEIAATGYGVRADGDDAYGMTLEGNEIEANLPVVVRKATGAYNLIVEGGSYIASNEKGAVVTFTNGADGTFVHPTGNATAIIKDVNDVVVFGFVAKNNNKLYTLFKEALNEVANGQTIELLNAEGSENVDIEFTKNITFTVEGQAPNYALPVVTFQNAIVNIKDATIKTPELDARQNATINVINSTVYGVGSNDIIKSYYNGAINIDETSTVYTMQVTTMGYITVAGALNATWQTNVYGNGLITLNNGAQFKTAALQLTGQDYSGRDNTDEGRVGKPAEITVNYGANFVVGNVQSSSGADYSYNSNKGINIGTVNGKSAVLTLNGGDVDIYMADGQNVNIGTDGIVNIGASTMKTICRTENGTVGLINNGVINFTSDDAILETATEGLTIGYNLNQDKKVVYKDGKYQVVDKIYVAQISEDKKFETLAEAAEAANGAEITIIRDFEEVYAVADNAVVNINFDGKTLTGSILAPNANLTVANGTIINNDKGVSAIEINAGELTLNAVNISSERHAVRIDGAVTATIDGGTYKVLGSNKGTYYAANISGAANVKILNGTFVGPKGTSADSGSAVNVKAGATVTISGGEFSKGKNSTLASSGVLTLTGGTYDQDVQNYCAPSYICVKDNDLYKVIRGLIGSGTETDPYLIRNLTELEYFKASVNAGETTYNYPGRWVALGADIDMAGTTWAEGIGDGHEWSFDGNFNGNNYTIKNLTVEPYADANKYLCGGFFGYIYGGVTIKNLVIENATINCETTEGHNVGVLVGFANNNGGKANISNVTIKGDIKVDAPNAYGVGAIVGYSYREMCTITSCTVNANDDSYINGHSFVGGITGYSYNNAIISKCSVKNINVTATSYSAGGIVGIVLAGNKVSECTVENVTVSGQANIANVVGAIAANGIVVENCTAAEPLVGGNYSDNKPVEARINNKYYYATLEDALAATTGNNVTLLVPYVVEAGETVALDLNGKTVSMEDASAATSAMIKNYGNLTISNGKLSFKATAPSANNAYASNTISNYGEITIESGIIENLSTGSACYALDNYAGSTATINGGKLTAEKTTVRVFNWTNGEANATTLNVNDGEIYSKDGYGINVNSGKTPYVALNIEGGTITTDDTDYNLAVYVVNNNSAENFTVNVTAGTFNGNFALNGVTSTTMATGNVSISGGTFEGVICYATPAYGFITGGAFVNDPSAFLAENHSAIYDDGIEYYIVKLTSGSQTREFTQGWNWFSSYINLSTSTGLEKLETALGTSGVQIKGQTNNQSATYEYLGEDENGNELYAWLGSFTPSMGKMYMVKTSAPVTAQITGDFIDYEKTTIVLNKGWNWISYPLQEEVEINEALKYLEPSEGDIIKMYGPDFAEYSDGYWDGIETLKPGLGYMYKSAKSTSFVYSAGEGTTTTSRSDDKAIDYHWTPETSEYAFNMSVIATLNVDGEMMSDNYEIAAFANGECRGSARPIYIERLGQYMLFLTIYGDEVEELTFKCYDVNYGTEYELSNRFNYSSDVVLGSKAEPYMFYMNTLNIEESTLDMINIYPNPTTTDRAINLQATCDNVEVFNALGVKVAEYQNVDSIDALETAGVYVIRVTINGEIKNCRLVVK